MKTLTPAECVYLLEVLDKVPVVGLRNQEQSLLLERKLMAISYENSTPPAGSTPKNEGASHDVERTDG